MSTPMNEEACALIEQAGGSAALSRITGYSVQRVNNWKVRGIPAEAKVQFPELLWPGRPDRAVPTTGSSAEPGQTEGTNTQAVV